MHMPSQARRTTAADISRPEETGASLTILTNMQRNWPSLVVASGWSGSSFESRAGWPSPSECQPPQAAP